MLLSGVLVMGVTFETARAGCARFLRRIGLRQASNRVFRQGAGSLDLLVAFDLVWVSGGGLVEGDGACGDVEEGGDP